MEAGNILYADVLDIIFDTRNKDYGAYDLRKNYQQRLVKSLLGMVLVVVLLLTTYKLVAAITPASNSTVKVKEVELENVADKKKPEPPVVPPPVKKLTQPAVKMLKSTIPLIVKEDVPEDEKPPLNDDLDKVKIGLVNTNGNDDIGITGPPVDEKKGITAVQKKNDDDIIFRKVEIESQYPGGPGKWGVYLNRHLLFPQDAVDAGIQGTVYIQFIVDKDGNVSDVTAISGPEQLRAAAVAAIKASGKWLPAIQNGREVKSYKNQPVTFKLETDQ